ncbi:hypothetical protein E2C01_013899 [Portunus trituberculatus]|uniref:Uncharacterized protein n=1 Tax=Portunus trituberculatus TaxID=210409 RepID=A0A5B7DII8_PORTR|nr:hypothetical protein [Portunus trituberculatus]
MEEHSGGWGKGAKKSSVSESATTKLESFSLLKSLTASYKIPRDHFLLFLRLSGPWAPGMGGRGQRLSGGLANASEWRREGGVASVGGLLGVGTAGEGRRRLGLDGSREA